MNSYNPPGYQPIGSKRNSKLPKGGTGQSKRPPSTTVITYLDEDTKEFVGEVVSWLPFKDFKTVILIFPDGTTKELSAEEFNKQFKRHHE